MLFAPRALCFAAVLFTQGLAGCPLTKQETDMADYTARRQQRYSDGTIQKQINDGSYTADSLSIDMYRWWVQLGLGNQRDAIDQFQTMIDAAGKEFKQPAKATDWSGVAFGWLNLILQVAGTAVAPEISMAVAGIQNTVTTWKTAAAAAADPAKGGSSDYLQAAMKWRNNLPSLTTNQLLMVDTFINEIKSKGNSALLPAYKFVTDLIGATRSYRYSINAYYAEFLKSSIPQPTNAFYLTSWNFIQHHGSSFQKLLWSSSPQGQNGCTIANEIMQINQNCLGPQTPGFESTQWKVLLAYGKQGSPSLWYGLQYDCKNLAPNAWEGCWNGATSDKGGNEWLPTSAPLCAQFGQMMFNSQKPDLKSAFITKGCSLGVDSVDTIAAGNWVDQNQFPIDKFDSVSDISSYTCKPSFTNHTANLMV